LSPNGKKAKLLNYFDGCEDVHPFVWKLGYVVMRQIQMTKSTQFAEVARQLSDVVVRQVEVFEQRQRRDKVQRQDLELVVRGIEKAQSSEVGEVVYYRQPVKRDVEAV